MPDMQMPGTAQWKAAANQWVPGSNQRVPVTKTMGSPQVYTGIRTLPKQHKYPEGTHQLNFVLRQPVGHNLEFRFRTGKEFLFPLNFLI